MTSITKIAVACAALAAASGAFAQKAGDNIVGVGIASVNPSANLGPLTNSNGANVADSTASVGSATTISFGLLHMFTDSIGAEFTLGVPPRVTMDLNAPHLGGAFPSAAKVDVWTPTVVAKYFFGTAQDKWRPYAGLGVSRVSFHNVGLSDDVTIQHLGAISSSMTSSWTPVYNAGAIYNIDDKWSINGSVSYLPVKTSATFVGVAGTTTGDIKMNTTDYVIRLGYRF